jgi:uncharacterized membrane protein
MILAMPLAIVKEVSTFHNVLIVLLIISFVATALWMIRVFIYWARASKMEDSKRDCA